jgi:hypothetical protein
MSLSVPRTEGVRHSVRVVLEATGKTAPDVNVYARTVAIEFHAGWEDDVWMFPVRNVGST